MNRLASVVTAAVATGLSVAVLGTIAASQDVLPVDVHDDDDDRYELLAAAADSFTRSANPAVSRHRDDDDDHREHRDREHEEHEEHEDDDD